MKTNLVRQRIGNFLFVSGCIVISAWLWGTNSWFSWVAWGAVGFTLIALSQIFYPFKNQLKSLHAAPLVEPSHISHYEQSQKASNENENNAT